MTYELRINLLEPAKWIESKNDPIPPGVRVRGPFSTFLASEQTPGVLEYLIVYLPFIYPLAKEVALDVVKKWLIDFITKQLAARPCINGKEPKNRSDVERIVNEEIVIGKND